jgi:16S rRNA G966 N2-methylase RsmD
MKHLKINPELQRLIPPLTVDEFNQLEANILAEGIRESVIVWQDTIVDGHNRYQIAQRHNLEYDTSEMYFKSLDDCKEWMILNQFGRRNLSNYQRSVLALELEQVFRDKAKENLKLSEGRGKKGLHISANLIDKIDTRQELAKIASVSHDTIAKVKQIEAKAPEEVKEKLRTGEVSINQAYQEIKKEEKKEAKAEERRTLAEIGSKKTIEIDFRLGDFEFVFSDIPDGSVDCIITDPPYPHEFIDCWSKLSRVAKRILKPHGFCIAYSGQMYLPEVLQRMSEHLDYYWTFAVYHEGNTQIVNGINLMCRWKPVLIFQNGKKKIENTFQDYFVSEKREKNAHDWQQSTSGVAYLVEMFTKPNDLIVEPFAGSGTTLLVANQKGRRIIGAEINEETYNIAKANL